jgi:hypothetical protein
MSGTGRRRRRGLVGILVAPWWRRWRTGRRCRGPVGGLVGGDVGGLVGGDVGDWSEGLARSTRGWRRWRLVGGDVPGTGRRTGRWRCRGLVGGVRYLEDWPVHPWAATLADRAAMSGTAGGLVGGDVGGLVGGDVGGTGRRGLVTLGGDALATGRRRCRGPVEDRSVAMSGTGRARRGGLVGGLVGPPVGGDAGDRRRCRGPGRRTGRWRCRGLDGTTSGTGRRITVHPWVATEDWSAAMSGTGGGLVGGDVGDRRRRRGPVGGLVGPPVGGDVGGPAGGDVGDR